MKTQFLLKILSPLFEKKLTRTGRVEKGEYSVKAMGEKRASNGPKITGMGQSNTSRE